MLEAQYFVLQHPSAVLSQPVVTLTVQHNLRVTEFYMS